MGASSIVSDNCTDTTIDFVIDGVRWTYVCDPVIVREAYKMARRKPGAALNHAKRYCRSAHKAEPKAPQRNPRMSVSEAQAVFERLGGDLSKLKSEYRRLALAHHPDRGGDEDTFKRLGEAYEALSRGQAKLDDHTSWWGRQAGAREQTGHGGGEADFLRTYPQAYEIVVMPTSYGTAGSERQFGPARRLHELYRDLTSNNVFFRSRAHWILNHYNDPDLRCGFFVQIDPGHFLRGAATLDYTPATLQERIDSFRHWCEHVGSTHQTKWIEIDGVPVWGNKTPSCPNGRHRWGIFQGPSKRRCAECGDLVDWLQDDEY